MEHYIIYRSQAFDKDGNPIGTITTIDVDTTGIDTTNVVQGPGDATVPVRSAIMSDYSEAANVDKLKKCVMNGTKHSEEMLDSLVRLQVRAILMADVDEAVPFCSTATPSPTPRSSMRGPLFTFMEKLRANSHPPTVIGVTTISGLAGELRRLEDQAPSVLSTTSAQLQDYIQTLSDPDVTALTDALALWGLTTQTLWRHAPSFGLAVQTAASSTDVAIQRTTLQEGIVDSFLHNVAQAVIQMMLNAAAETHSSEEDGMFNSHIDDLRTLQGIIDELAITQRAPKTWARFDPVLTALSLLTPSEETDVTVVKLEGVLIALAGAETYSAWVLRDANGALQSSVRPEQDKGGSERARILVLWKGTLYEPGVSSSGVDWQDMGVPRIRTNSTGWVGTPSLSTESPARWIGTVPLVRVADRLITGRVLTVASDTLAALTVRGYATGQFSAWSSVQEITTMGADGRFTLKTPQGLDIRLSLQHPQARPAGPLPVVPAGVSDVDLGDIIVTAFPVLTSVSATPERPERGATVTLSAVATHPLGAPLTYIWERQAGGRWSWEVIGSGAQVEWITPTTPDVVRIRVIISDTASTIVRWLSITPANHSPEIISLRAEIDSVQTDTPQLHAGGTIDFSVAARDIDGDSLTYRWTFASATSEGNATWKTYWNPEDVTYTVRVRASDGALFDEATLRVTVLGRPDPIAVIDVTPSLGVLPVDVTFTAMASETVGQIVRYDWLIQKKSQYSYFLSSSFTQPRATPSYRTSPAPACTGPG